MPPPLPLILKWSTVLIYHHCNTSPGMIWYGLFMCWKFGFVCYDVQLFMCWGFFHFAFWYFMENWYHHLHKIKKALFSITPPPPPLPLTVLEINKLSGELHRWLLDQISIERFHKVHPIKIRDWGNQTGETLKSSNVAILAASKLAARRLT